MTKIQEAKKAKLASIAAVIPKSTVKRQTVWRDKDEYYQALKATVGVL